MSLYLADALFICIKLSPVDGEKSFPFASRNIPIMKPGINETQKPTIFGVSPSNGKHPVKISAASVKLGDRHLDVVPLTVEDAHVAFECTPTYELTITDLESKYGTYVNGEPLEGTQTLRSGDVITLGCRKNRNPAILECLPDIHLSPLVMRITLPPVLSRHTSRQT